MDKRSFNLFKSLMDWRVSLSLGEVCWFALTEFQNQCTEGDRTEASPLNSEKCNVVKCCTFLSNKVWKLRQIHYPHLPGRSLADSRYSQNNRSGSLSLCGPVRAHMLLNRWTEEPGVNVTDTKFRNSMLVNSLHIILKNYQKKNRFYLIVWSMPYELGLIDGQCFIKASNLSEF